MITAAIAFTTLTLMALSGHIAASAPRGLVTIRTNSHKS